VGIDARDGFVRVHGWKEAGDISATELALRMRDLGMQTIIFTDIRRDGLGAGLNLPATKALAEASGLAVIASGGVHTLDDIRAARDVDLAGVIIGRALYEGTVNLREACLALNHESHRARKAE
jgi:phosphoribosylformimino-5-aminoimidazole carboxamide ribotide isomerase